MTQNLVHSKPPKGKEKEKGKRSGKKVVSQRHYIYDYNYNIY